MGVIQQESRRSRRGALDWLLAPSRTTMRRLAIASLASNILLVVTGGAVRLTGSGLGCPTWPQCTDQSLVARDALGIHGFIEFGNRLLTFLLVAIAILTWLAAMRYRPTRSSLRWLATAIALGIPLQAVVGGITVLTELNPWVVAFHLLTSLAIIGVAVVLIRRVDEDDRAPVATVPRPVVLLGRATFAAAWLVLYAGTIVTGSGPHAGDARAPRTGLSPAAMSELHADLVFLLVGLTIGTVVALHTVHAPERARRAATWLLGIELAQGVVGYTQYFTGLPIGLVAVHMLGAALVSAAAAWVLLGLRDRGVQRT
ncbi:MAG: COX15/CtaA family protein [Nocardioidaceae bacterium]